MLFDRFMTRQNWQ